MFITKHNQSLAQAIVDTVREPILVLDGDLRVVAASRSFYAKFKVDRHDTEGRLLKALGDGQWDIPALTDQLKAIVREQGVLDAFEVELTFPEIGRCIMLLNAQKIHYKRGDFPILLAFEDVTAARLAERERDLLMRQKELLLDEMQHRVANSLQIIASILLMKARAIPSEEVRTHLRDAHKRVLAVAAVQKYLRPTAGNELIAMRPYLTQLCASLAGSMIGDRPIVINPLIADIEEKSRSAASIALIVTELVVNALKHAFPVDKPNSKIDVIFSNGPYGWELAVTDNGVGRAMGGAAKSEGGLGTSLVDALADQFGARVERKSTAFGMSVSIANEGRDRNPGLNAGVPVDIKPVSVSLVGTAPMRERNR